MTEWINTANGIITLITGLVGLIGTGIGAYFAVKNWIKLVKEKNALRAKILDEYRLYTDERKNPMKAWSEMEHHSFFKLVEDYESLGGNDYVHGTIIPAMNELDVISMSDSDRLKELYQSRSIN